MILEGIKKTAYLFLITLLTLFTLYIVFCTFGNFDYADYLMTFMKAYSVPIYLLTGAIVIFAIVHVVGNFISKFNQKQMRVAAGVIGLGMFAVQIAVVYFIRSPLRSDPGNVFDQALDMFSTGLISPTAVENYFAIYPNNIPLCIFEHLILKFGSLLGLNYGHYLFFLDIVNILFIDLAMFFSYKIIKMLKSEVLAVKFMILCAVNPLLYAYSILVYTSTLSMPFIIGAIYFFLRITKEQKTVKKLIYTAATVVTLYLGFTLRATVIVTVAAILIYLLLQVRGKITKNTILNTVKIVVIVLISFVIAKGIYQTVENKYVKFDTAETGFPLTHWLMMGAQGSGGFNVEDFNFTLNIPTREERIEANLTEYKKRIIDMGIPGMFQLILNKTKVTWSDGLDATIDSLSDNKTYYAINDYLTGSKKDLYVSYCHMYHLMLMLLMAVSVMRGFKRKYDNPILIIYLNLLGGIIFHLLWEAGAAYNICFTFLIIILAADGLEFISGYSQSSDGKMIRRVRKLEIVICGATILSTIILLIAGYPKMVETPFKQYPIAANQDFHENEPPALMQGEELMQTFVTSRAFNRIQVKVRNFTGEVNQSLYEIQLLDANDNVLVTDEIVGSMAIDTDYYRIPIETIVPDKATEYKIRISTKSADENNNIVFMLYNTGNWNIYEDGKLFVNGQESRGSLTFQICESDFQTFFTKSEYIKLAAVILLVEIILTMLITSRKTKKEVDNSLI